MEVSVLKKIVSPERLSRLLVSALLFCGLYLPTVKALAAQSALAKGLLWGALVLLCLWAIGGLPKKRLITLITAVAVSGVMLLLPGRGFWGDAAEAVKAITLYTSGGEAATSVFASAVALTLGVLIAIGAYLFTHRNAGFLPAAICVVLMLYGIWSYSESSYLWYTLPAFVALLLLISQTGHRKNNLFEVLPMAAMVAVVSMLLLPAKDVVITPLYDAAMELKQSIEDYLFFTDARDVFSIGNYGWYPMGSGKLGGAVEVEEIPALLVKSDEKVLLRGVTKDEYTGRSWRDTGEGKRYLYVNPRWSRLRRSAFLEDLPPASVQNTTELLQQKAISVQVQNTGTSTVPAPAYLRSFSSGGDLVAYFNDSAELFITRNLQRDDRYTVFAPVVEGGGSELGAVIEAVEQNTADSDYAAIVQRYTALPDHMEQKVYEDTLKIAGDASAYGKACAIMRYLQKYYKLTLTPETPPENQDFVTYFLYVTKEGYSTYFASAMTVMCRMAGLPARYVEGFRCTPSDDGLCYVTNLDACAWTEVYFKGFGWVPFDPTPVKNDNNSKEDEPEPTPTPTPPPDEPEPTPTPPDDIDDPDDPDEPDEPDDPENEQDDEHDPFPWWWLLLVLAVIGACTARVIVTDPERNAAKAAAPGDKVMIYASAAHTLLTQRGFVQKNSEPPMRYARRVDRAAKFSTKVLPIAQMLTVTRYSRIELTEADSAHAGRIYRALYKEQKLPDRIRFRLKLACSRNPFAALDLTMQSEKPQGQFDAMRAAIDRKNSARKRQKGKQTTPRAADFAPPQGWQRPVSRTPEAIAAEVQAEREEAERLKKQAMAEIHVTPPHADTFYPPVSSRESNVDDADMDALIRSSESIAPRRRRR